MKTIFFDVETGALPESEIAAIMPPFDPAEVKTGNLKDPDKIAAKLAEAEANHRRDFFERAALDPPVAGLKSSATTTRRGRCGSSGPRAGARWDA